MSIVRSFLAINLSPETGLEIQEAVSRWGYLGKGVKWVKPGNVHLTVKFLGNLTEDQVARVSETLRTICAGTAPFKLELGSPGVFPNLRSPRILWLGLNGQLDCLEEFRNQVEKALAAQGFEPDNRPFIPHITIGRIKGRPPSRERLVRFLRSETAGHVSIVDKLYFYQSRLTPAGPVYTPLSIHSFTGNTSQ